MNKSSPVRLADSRQPIGNLVTRPFLKLGTDILHKPAWRNQIKELTRWELTLALQASPFGII